MIAARHLGQESLQALVPPLLMGTRA
jgi:hypothetical protein